MCERVFLPPKQELQAQLASGAPLLTLESQTPVRDFDVIAFSVSFEWDYTNVVTMLRLAGCRRGPTARNPRHPLVVIGGAVTFVNPEPLALFADVIAAGEGEMLIPDADDVHPRRRDDRDDLLRRLAQRARLLHPVVLRRAVRGGRRDRGVRAEAGDQRAAGREEGRGQDHRAARSAGDVDLHARIRSSARAS